MAGFQWLIHLVTWFKLRPVVRNNKMFDIRHLQSKSHVDDVHHQEYGDHEDKVSAGENNSLRVSLTTTKA